MNHSFKSVFNRRTGTWQVTSEKTRNAGKTGNSISKPFLAIVLGLFSAAFAITKNMMLATSCASRNTSPETSIAFALRTALPPRRPWHACVAYSALLGVLLYGIGPTALANSMTDLGTLGGIGSSAWAVNAAGDVVVGESRNSSGQTHAFRWTQASNSMTDLGTLGGTASYALAVNAAGDVVVGQSLNSNGDTRAFRWTQASNSMTDLGTLGGTFSYAIAVNAAGDVVVGFGAINNNQTRAFRWTQASNSMADLGTLGGAFSIARGVNAAGDVVVGESAINSGENRAFRWTQASNSMTDLGTLGGTFSSARGVNAAGDVVVGQSDNSNGNTHAFRWTQASNSMTDLGNLGGISSAAVAVNAAGDVVVGNSDNSNGQERAFRWTQANGMQSITEWLTDHGVTLSGSEAIDAKGVSADGNTVVGKLANSRAYLARVTPANGGGGSGMIDVVAFTEGLDRVSNSGLLAINDASLVMNGLHSQPMRTLLAEGGSTVWLGGDAGRHDSGTYDSDLGVAEVGFGHRFNRVVQLNVSAGHTYSKANTGLGGRTTTKSTFVLPELVVTLPASVYATLSGYYGKGRSDIDRVYLNAGTPERSFASPGLTSLGARVRFDWLDAVQLGSTNLTPYASLSYLETRMNGYAEQGVAFPVIWDKRTDKATTAHVGLDAVQGINADTSLLGRVEMAHRFEDKGADTRGQIIGISGFNFVGQDIKQNWLRVGAGVETKLVAGKLGVMLNATTQGEAPSYWMSASYRWVF